MKYIETPCDVGDHVFALYLKKWDKIETDKAPYEFIVQSIHYSKFNKYITVFTLDGKDIASFNFYDFGKIVFSTREEAEAKIKEMKNE